MPVRAVFFDLDDTLCDTIGTRPQRARRALEVVARSRPDLDVERLVARVLEPIAGDRAARGLRAVLAEIEMAEEDAGVEAMRTYSFVGCEELLRCFESVDETLAELNKAYQLGVITNWSDEAEQLNKLRHLQLDQYIRHVVVSCSVGYEKPDVRIFGYALSLEGIEAQEAVFVGDRLDVDIVGAQETGMKAVWFNHWGGGLDGSAVRPDAVIQRFSDLPGAIADW